MSQYTLMWFLVAMMTFEISNSAPMTSFESSPAGAQNSGLFDSPELDVMVKRVAVILTGVREESFGVFGNFTCSSCKELVEVVHEMLDNKISFDIIAEVVALGCSIAKIEHKNVCNGIAKTFKEEALTALSMVVLSPNEVCGLLLGDECGHAYNPIHQYWNISIPGNKPPVVPVPPPKVGSPVTRILHLSDVHYDPLYTPGLSNKCGEPLCCRPPNPKGNSSDGTAAGIWGDYLCDVSNATLINLFEFLRNMSDEFDWIYWTGDLIAHYVWSQTRTDTLAVLQYFHSLFDKYLPDKPVFPVFGNHDAVPVDGFPPPFITGNQSMSWLIEPTVVDWGKWLSRYPNWTTTQESIKRGGFYNVKVRNGLRVIGLQTNFCERNNFWLWVNSTDPSGQFEWLVGELLKAEQEGDKVHILGHHAPGGTDAVPSFFENYRRIINRFESTIVGQFFGHTHTDSFRIYMDDSGRPTNIMYVGPGVTTYQGLNLGFRFYTVDGDYNDSTHAVLDHEVYILDMGQANRDNNPHWVWEYSAKKTYNLTSLQPESWYQFWKDMHTNDTLMHLYSKHWSKGTGGYNKPQQLCEVVSTTSERSPLCTTYKP